MIRDPTDFELEEIEARLTRLREHYECWPTEPGAEWHLCRFAYYEGCDRTPACAEILEMAAPLALGRELVVRHNCNWCIIETSSGPKIGVVHPLLASAVDLFALDSSPLLDPDEHDDEIDPFGPGQGAVESLFAIARKIRMRDNKSVNGRARRSRS